MQATSSAILPSKPRRKRKVVTCVETCLESTSTFAPAATAFQINALHCARLCAMLAVAHICPTACTNQIRIHTDASELLAVTLTAIAMSGESCSDEPESRD